MFSPDFYPTPKHVITRMLEGVTIHDKKILEPSAGKGNIIESLYDFGAKTVLFCENHPDLKEICKSKGKFLKDDFLTVEASDISHIDLIIMNPPFSADEKHIKHAYDIAPDGCKIIALCNAQTILNPYSSSRKQLKKLIEMHGSFENWGDCFNDSERSTGVEIGFINLLKPGGSYSTEFEGFFMEEEESGEVAGLMTYDVVRDLVGRYVESIKIFDKQLEQAKKMNELTSGYFSVKIGMNITNSEAPITRVEFKKEMQKEGWRFVFRRLNMEKYATTQLKSDINKFVEEQSEIPFNTRNIYTMLKIVVATTEQRMDKAILEVFDKVTQHYHENRFNVEGWKTNSHYLLNQRFIIPDMVTTSWGGGVGKSSYSNFDKIEDLMKALCYIAGDNYDKSLSLSQFIGYPYKVKIDGDYMGHNGLFTDLNKASHYCQDRINQGKNAKIETSKVEWGEWIEWGYFRIKCFKKGTIHFEFLDKELWGRFNQRVAKIKGFPLFEKAPDKRTERQKSKAAAPASKDKPHAKPKVMASYKLFTNA